MTMNAEVGMMRKGGRREEVGVNTTLERGERTLGNRTLRLIVDF